MSNASQLAKTGPGPAGRTTASRRFPVQVGRFDDPAARSVIDGLVRWVEQTYREELRQRPSKHVYVRTLPEPVTEQVDRLREGPVIRAAIMQQFDPDWLLTPMKHTDELYISHYNKDYGGDQGLFTRHYDGNLRFVSFGSVVRALIYLQSDASYKVVFEDSRIEKAFTTYDFALLDFHRELHGVEGEYRPEDRQRILLKCNYLIAPRNAAGRTRAVLGANTAVFYVVKAAMEYSKSPSTPAQRAVGLLCNVFRLMNNVHPFVPLAFLLLVAAAAGLAVHRLVA